MNYIHRLIAVAVIVLMTGACGSPRDANEDRVPSGTAPDSNSPVPTLDALTPTAAPTEVPADRLISAPGVADIPLLTGIAGAGAKPLFAWEPVNDAKRYQLIVFDETGEPYWAWEGAKTQIYMGGTETEPPEDSSGPFIDTGYTWAVVAYGSDEQIVATSEVRPISP